MLKTILILFIFSYVLVSCSFSPTHTKRSENHFIYGPLPPEPSIIKAKEDLTRSKYVPKIGKVSAQIITPAFAFLVSKEKKIKENLSPIERAKSLNFDIDYFIRYQSCFTVSVYTSDPNVIDFSWWKAYLVHEEKILPVKITSMTEKISEASRIQKEIVNEFSGYATICAADRINLSGQYTLVLHPKVYSGLSPIRFTWLEALPR